MEADPTSFNGSNKHKSLCKKMKLNAPLLIIGDITFFICHVSFLVREPQYNPSGRLVSKGL